MTVVSEGPLCIKIQLSRLETKQYFKSYENIVWGNPDTQKTVFYLLDTATYGLEFERNGKLMVEVFPSLSGGCIIKFTCEPSPEKTFKSQGKIYRIKNKKTTYTFMFENFENISRFISSCTQINTAEVSSGIYLFNNKYFLILNISDYLIKTLLLINEYSLASAKGIYPAEYIKEHGKCIIETRAIETVYEKFSKNN